MEAGRTLHDCLDLVVARHPGTGLVFHSCDEKLTLGELAEASRRAATGLRARGVREGDVVGILQPNEPGFLVTLFALSRLGAVAAPLPLPATGRQLEAYAQRLTGVLGSAPFTHVVTTAWIGDLVAAALPEAGRGVERLAVEDLGSDAPLQGSGSRDGDAVAILQFTSGSTSSPKGVPLRHRTIMAGLAAITEGIAIRDGDMGGFWIPLFHDMGLFGTLAAVVNGQAMHIWSPADFVRNPRSWLRQMASVGATVSAGPNFFYQYLVDYVAPDEVADLDLSRWRIAFNGAEYISAETVEAFLAHFAPAGFAPEAMFPVYGMAEATLAVTFPTLGSPPRIDRVDRRRLASGRQAVQVGAAAADARAVVGVGSPVRGIDLRIARAGGGRAGDREVGEIQIRGTPVMDGYLSGDASEFTPSGWYRTGDLGYVAEGQVFVTGRLKEMIAVRGLNCYAEDIEEAVRATPGIYKGRCIAVPLDGEERFGVVAETIVGEGEERATLLAAIRGAITTFAPEIGGAHEIRLVGRGDIPRTSSGKYRRLAAAQAFRPQSATTSQREG